MAYACIDIGSNTTRLLVAEPSEGRLRELMTQRAFTSLGKATSKGRIPEDKIEETAEVVATQARLARELGADEIAVVATAAVRSAKNRDEFGAAIEAESGLTVRVLSGHEEARLAFLGATRTFSGPLDGSIAVVDVGGGSTEIAVGSLGGGVTWCWTGSGPTASSGDSRATSMQPAVARSNTSASANAALLELELRGLDVDERRELIDIAVAVVVQRDVGREVERS